MMKNQFEIMDCFRGEKADDLNIESREGIDVAPVELVHTAAAAKEAILDTVDTVQDEKIELWMRNIREFIRSIDVKAL